MCNNWWGPAAALFGIGVGDKVFMLENTWYTVISPKAAAAFYGAAGMSKWLRKQLRLTGEDMLKFGPVDGVIPEPLEGHIGIMMKPELF